MNTFASQIKTISRKQAIVWTILFLIVCVGAFLRLYHFSDWLHFELDQARDVLFVSEAVEHGPQELPLLGPKASGTTLRVGPAFYYMEYLSALVFGNTPQGHALFVPLLSILSIVMLYLLLKRVFPISVALGLTYLYAISAFFVLYSRFAWNPNVLPFFLLGGMLTLFWALDERHRHPGRWLVVSSGFFVIATQLHFVAFFAVPFFVAVTLLIRRPNFSWKTWVFAVFVVPFVAYFPLLINEWAFEGQNTKAFFEALGSKKEGDGIRAQISSNFLTQAKAYALILSGNERIVLPYLKFKSTIPEIKCGDYCKKTPDWIRNTTIIFFFAGMLGLFWQAIRKKGELAYVLIWFLAISFTFTGIASQLAPRFFPLLVPLPYIFLGVLLSLLAMISRWAFWSAFIIVLAVFTYSNLSLMMSRAYEMQNVATKNISISTDRIIEEPVRVTYEQQLSIARFLAQEYEKNGHPVRIDAESFWRRSVKYLAEREFGVSIGFLTPGEVYANSNSYILLRTKKEGGSVFKKYTDAFDIGERQEFGTLSLYAVYPKAQDGLSDAPPEKPIVETDGGDISRITWKDAVQAIKEKYL